MRPSAARVASILVVAALALLVSAGSVVHGTGDETAPPTATPPAPVALPNGWFFPLPDGPPSRGFAVLDEPDGPAFWTAFQRNGGEASLGRPLSRSFALADGAIYQLFTNGLLRWEPGGPPPSAVTTIDLLAFAHMLDLDDHLWWLGVPRRAPPWEGAGVERADPQVRLGWLVEPRLRDYYLGTDATEEEADEPSGPAALPPGTLAYGWPESRPEHFGAYIAQRFERAVLVVWVDPPRHGPPAGTVEPLRLGPLVVATGVLSGLATTPDTLFGNRLVRRAPRPRLAWPRVSPTPAATPSATPTSPVRLRRTVAPVATPAVAEVVPGALIRITAVVNEGNREYVVLTNEGGQAQAMQGWVLQSLRGRRQRFVFPAGSVLAPGASVRVHSGRGSSAAHAPPGDLAWTGRNVWNNSGDTAVLLDSTGREVSRFTY